MSSITTRDNVGNVNGWLLPIWNATERPDLRPEQVYLTVVMPGKSKGPHLHMKRRGLFTCVRGMVKIVVGNAPQPTEYTEHILQRDSEPLLVPPGCPAQIVNIGPIDAYLLNMPSPAWTKDDQDDWPVDNWNPPCSLSPTAA